MLPVSFPQKNFEFTKPEGMTDEQCMSLPVCVCELKIDDSGSKAMHVISCWQLSKEDLDEINRTGRIYLGVMGMQPPVFLAAENPCPDDGY